jgi:tetratricopeptide (TPR) repeat protein
MKLSLLKLQAGRYARAFDLAQSCVFAADRLAVDESLQLMARQGLARVLTELGRHREAKAAIKEAMALSLASTNPEGRGLLLTDLGEIYRRTGDAQAAIPLLTEAVELLSPLQKHDATAYAVIRLADSHLSEGRFEVARKLLQRHQATLQRANDAKSQALIAHITAQLASDELSSTKAVPDATMSDVDIALRSRLTTDPGELLGLGRAATTGGHWSLAEEILDRCLERLGSDAPAASRVECHDALAILAAAMARGARLIEHRRQALRLIRKLGDDLEYLRRLCELVTEAVELHQLAGIGMDSHQLLELAATGGPSADTIRALYAAIMGFAAIGARSEVRKAALLMQEYCIKIPDFEGSGESLKVAQFALAETAASQKAR